MHFRYERNLKKLSLIPKTIRIFISSTFSDFTNERNALKEIVFPRLRQLCEEMGARFQAVDLRWGVSEEAGLDQQTINICLDEIHRCQRISPRPNFLILLGDRYGWQPVPAAIPSVEFKSILDYLLVDSQSDSAREALKHWYTLDNNVVPPVYRLRARTGKYTNYNIWRKVEYSLQNVLRDAVEAILISEESREKYYLSATGQEIVLGALNPPEGVPEPIEHVFCFFRSIRNLPSGEQAKAAKDFLDLDLKEFPNPEARGQLELLKTSLKKKLPGNIFYYDTQWAANGITTGHIKQLCLDVEIRLSEVIRSQLSKIEKKSDLEQEIEAHVRFQIERSSYFLGRDDILSQAREYLLGKNTKSLAIYGRGGSGKSSLMARIIDEVQSLYPEATVIFRFIGITPASSTGRSLLDSICRQIGQGYVESNNNMPVVYGELVELFFKSLTFATTEHPIVLIIDGLDQLPLSDDARRLGWLPRQLPGNVKLIVSTIHGDCLKALQRKINLSNLIRLKPMIPQEGEGLLETWLRGVRRTLQPDQREEVLSRFKKLGLPLYLKLAFEETCHWKSSERKKLSPGINSMIRRLFDRLSREANHGSVMVAKSVGYLVAARFGLSEDELMDILSRDQDVLQDYWQRSPKSPREDRLPFIVWSRLYFDIEPFLVERDTQGTATLCFFHRQFEEVVKKLFLKEPDRVLFHKNLADYFLDQEIYLDKNNRVLNRRKLSELPYHLAQAGLLGNLASVLSDAGFIIAKVEMGNAAELMDEMDAAYNQLLMKPSGQKLYTRIPKALFQFFIGLNGIENPQLTLEEIHASLIYKKNTLFYEAFLSEGLSENEIRRYVPGLSEDLVSDIYTTFSSRKANMERRAGSLKKAYQRISAILPVLKEKPYLLRELARTQYDIGYIQYLRGKFKEAAEYLAMSAQSAESLEDLVGSWVSKCVEHHVRLISKVGTVDFDEALHAFLEVLNQAYQVFVANQSTNSTAERWVMNVNAHRFKVAFFKKDRKSARFYLNDLESDPWVRRSDDKSFLLPYQARMAVLRRDYQAAARYFVAYLKPLEENKVSLFKIESMAENYLDYGMVLYENGKKDEAVSCWKTGLSFPDEPGNQKWKEMILKLWDDSQ
jgi:hypothetical protein